MTDPWQDHAACLGSDPALWFDNDRIEEARTVCMTCPVAQQCAEAAFAEEGSAPHGRYGTRAGMSADQRTAIRKIGGLDGRSPLGLWGTRP